MTSNSISNSVKDTMDIAEKLAQKAQPGDIIALSGELGTGKTAFAKGFAKGLGVKGYVSSPSFTLVQIYEDGRLPLCHFDLYRLADPVTDFVDEDILEGIGFFEYLDADNICLIEWAEYAKEYIPNSALWVEIRRDDDKDRRKIYLHSHGYIPS